MVLEQEVTYEMVLDVTQSWSTLKHMPNVQTMAGELIYMKLLELEPKVAQVLNLDVDAVDFRDSPRFSFLARSMFDMLDCTVSFLGPDLDDLAHLLVELGQRHVKLGVRPEYLTSMGKAILLMLREMLGHDKFRPRDVQAWATVYSFMVHHMIRGMEQE